MNKRTLKIVVMYLISFLCLVSFYVMETSNMLDKLLELPFLINTMALKQVYYMAYSNMLV